MGGLIVDALTLWFRGRETPELLQTEFIHPILGGGSPLRMARGKGNGAYGRFGTFQWTTAVQALVLFLLRAKLRRTIGSPVLSGERGSPAASLDYAVTKQPTWLLSMFGWDEAGTTLSRQFIRRTNSNLKFRGPIALNIDRRVLNPDAIRIFWDDREVTSESEINKLASAIESHFPSSANGACQLVHDVGGGELVRLMESAFIREARASLVTTDIFDPTWVSTALKRIGENQTFVAIAGKSGKELMGESLSRGQSYRLGLGLPAKTVANELMGSRRFRIAVPLSAISALIIFRYLTEIKGYHLDVCYEFPHAIDIANRISRSEFTEVPDACVIALAPAATLLRQHQQNGYSPTMFMPSIGHRIISSKRSQRNRPRALGSGRYALLKDDPSTAMFYFEELIRAEKIEGRKVATEHQEPDRVFQMLRCGDAELNAVLFFPYHDLNVHFNRCEYLDHERSSSRFKETMLFVHESLRENVGVLSALQYAIRDAWLELLANPEVVQRLTNELLKLAEFQKLLIRYGGLFYASSASFQDGA